MLSSTNNRSEPSESWTAGDAGEVPCTHCGLDVPRGLREPTREEQFCCSGCQTAYELIQAGGLSEYYRLVQRQGRPVAEPQWVRNQAFDHPEFLELYSRGVGETQRRITLGLSGIHCVACVWLIEKLPQLLPGVISCQVQWARGTVDLRWEPAVCRLSEVVTTIERLGYGVQPLREGETHSLHVQENREQLIRLGIAGAAAGNNMLIATALYLGMFSSIAPAIEELLRYASCLIGVVSLAWPGRVFFQSAWQAIRTRTPHMDLPIALGLLAGGIGGTVNTLRGSGEIYFDSLSVLVFLLLVGRYIQYRQQRRAADAIDLLHQMTPRIARKVVQGEFWDTPLELLKVGDVVEVRANETLGVDGEVISGHTAVDESLLTGESLPVVREPGQAVWAGTLNLHAAIRVRVLATGVESRLGKLMEMIEESTRQRPAIVEWAHTVGGYFVAVVLVLSVITLGISLGQGWGSALDRVVATLIVACPCALALATPLTISVALGRAAKRQILIKGGDVLQRLHQAGKLWLDKTGTLTQGRMRMVEWHGSRQWAPWVAAIEGQSQHPIAVALSNPDFRQAFAESESRCSATASSESASDTEVPAKCRNLDPWAAARERLQQVEQLSTGIRGIFPDVLVTIGNRCCLEEHGVEIPTWGDARAAHLVERGVTPIFVAADKRLVAVAGVGDPLRPEAREAVAELRRRGWDVGILSGDHPQVVAHVGQLLGLPSDQVHGGLLPEEKRQRIVESAQHGPTVMVGDGVNDSAALAAASVGIAVHGGAEASLQAAAVYLNQAGLVGILDLLQASQRTRFTIFLNFAASLGYNILAVALAMAGWINPLVAALLMPLSSLTVVTIALARPTFGRAAVADRGVTAAASSGGWAPVGDAGATGSRVFLEEPDAQQQNYRADRAPRDFVQQWGVQQVEVAK